MSAEQARASRPLLPLAGAASPVVLAAATLVIAAGRPDYSHVRDTISELGAVGRPGAIWMRFAGIAPAGALTTAAALPLYRTFGAGALSRAGALALASAGLAFIGTALFPWTGPPNDLSSLSSKLHLGFALAGFLLLALAPLLLGWRGRHAPATAGWSFFSLATSALVFAFAFLLPRPPYLGAFQRAALGVFYLWLVAASLRAWRTPLLDKPTAARPS